MKKIRIWFAELVGFLIVCALFDLVPWHALFGDFKKGLGVTAQGLSKTDAAQQEGPSLSNQNGAAPTGNGDRGANPHSTAPIGSEYFPEDTLRLRYEYTAVLAGLKLEMVIRVDGVRTINGKEYYKEIIEFPERDDIIARFKDPNASKEVADFANSKAGTDFLKFLDPSIKYARWDEAGTYELDGDLSAPEYRDPPFPIDVGSEWTTDDAHLRVIGIEDVEAGGTIFKNCIAVRATNPSDASIPEGLYYNAAGIGTVKMTVGTATFTLQKYER